MFNPSINSFNTFELGIKQIHYLINSFIDSFWAGWGGLGDYPIEPHYNIAAVHGWWPNVRRWWADRRGSDRGPSRPQHKQMHMYSAEKQANRAINN